MSFNYLIKYFPNYQFIRTQYIHIVFLSIQYWASECTVWDRHVRHDGTGMASLWFLSELLQCRLLSPTCQ